MEPKDVFEAHYQGNPNPMTPVVVEYGWVTEGDIAYELSRDTRGSLWGLTLVAWNGGQTVELADGRWAGFTDAEARRVIDERRKYYGTMM